jgi:ArsR family transcriptional regulator
MMETTEQDKVAVADSATDENVLEPLISLANALFDTDRLRIAAHLVAGPASRMELAQMTGLSQRELLRQVGLLQYFGLVKTEGDVRNPDHHTRYELNQEAFRAARQAMGKFRGVKPRPTDSRELTLETFMPGGKLVAFPKKNDQMVVILTEMAQKFEAGKQYTEKEVNVILEDINEDYCTLRRCLVDYGYLSRSAGVYNRNA